MPEISLRMGASESADLLVRRYGADAARRKAVCERGIARRARSRKRFQFWAAVAEQIEVVNSLSERQRLLSNEAIAVKVSAR